MSKFVKYFSVILLFIFSLNNSGATFFKPSITWNSSIITNTKNVSEITIKLDNIDRTPVSISEVFSSFASYYEWKIPKSYKYINLKITWVDKKSKLYNDLQKLVYIDILPNKSFKLKASSKLSAYSLYKLAEKLFKVNLVSANNIKYLKSRKANKNDLIYLKKILNKKDKKIEKEIEIIKIQTKSNWELYKQKQAIFNDVYDTIKSSHYDRKTISDIDLIEWATRWLADWTWDKFTTYFPPVENKNFQESLDWNFEWIGSYVEMEKPWILKIISPIPGSPSEKAGLKWGDIILKADWKEITKNTSLREAISWIKWPKWTTVTLTILRNWKV